MLCAVCIFVRNNVGSAVGRPLWWRHSSSPVRRLVPAARRPFRRRSSEPLHVSGPQSFGRTRTGRGAVVVARNGLQVCPAVAAALGRKSFARIFSSRHFFFYSHTFTVVQRVHAVVFQTQRRSSAYISFSRVPVFRVNPSFSYAPGKSSLSLTFNRFNRSRLVFEPKNRVKNRECVCLCQCAPPMCGESASFNLFRTGRPIHDPGKTLLS